MLNNYIILKDIGKGSLGRVKLAIRRNNSKVKKYAIKILKKKFLMRKREVERNQDGKLVYKTSLEQVKGEIEIMKSLNHPNIVTLFEVLDTPTSEKIYMVMEYAEGGAIVTWDSESQFFSRNNTDSPKFSEEEIRQYFRDLIRAINYCFQYFYTVQTMNIVHRDIKPQNILQDKNKRLLLCDFGIATLLNNHNEMKKTKGTFLFTAPELLLTSESNDVLDTGKCCDVWSMGITIFSFAFLKMPFYESNKIKFITLMKENE